MTLLVVEFRSKCRICLRYDCSSCVLPPTPGNLCPVNCTSLTCCYNCDVRFECYPDVDSEDLKTTPHYFPCDYFVRSS